MPRVARITWADIPLGDEKPPNDEWWTTKRFARERGLTEDKARHIMDKLFEHGKVERHKYSEDGKSVFHYRIKDNA